MKAEKESAKSFFMSYRFKYLRECYESLLIRCDLISRFYKNKDQKLDELIDDIIKLNDEIQRSPSPELELASLPEKLKLHSQAVVETLRWMNEKSPISPTTEEMISYIVDSIVKMEDVLTGLILGEL